MAIITISVGRSGPNLNVVVEDDGSGLGSEEQGGLARSSGSGLGTQIINTFVTNDFGGSVHWEPRREGGTRVVLDMKLRLLRTSDAKPEMRKPSKREGFLV